MGRVSKIWDALTTVIKMRDKVVPLAGTVKEPQSKIERLVERAIRFDATLERLLRAGGDNQKLLRL
ncbi:hypothetical protein KQH60_12765 [Mycetohabitans sp. B8]|uniref:hypothetical protein n=1 Tax=Mycetohabitans sp. B8 TaxID=2841845 RepID=UPI001F32E666|nr:hypothetical protein [Mycetohabitans sp. B8]MCG1043356.1 hypothetical protein [Mycetohabitans sp. B8]